jgi:hypothetical protein
VRLLCDEALAIIYRSADGSFDDYRRAFFCGIISPLHIGARSSSMGWRCGGKWYKFELDVSA